LTFYSCGDEAYQYWAQLCSTCYEQWAASHPDRAKIILEWIKEDAKSSRQWAIEEFGSFDNVDFEKGHWGH